MLRVERFRLAGIVFLCLGLGCVSGSIRHVNVTNELPGDLPKDVKEKFEVKELGAAPQPSPSPESGAESSTKGKKKKRKKKEVARKPESVDTSQPPFVVPTRRPEKDPIWIGEKLVYSISYFGVSAGDFTLEILPFKMLGSRKVYHIRGNAISSPVFSLFYRLNDVVESFMDYDGNFSHRFHLVLDETKQTRDALELNDSEKKQTFYWNRWHPKDGEYRESKEFAPIQPYSQDSLSALYYLRTVPLPTGSVVTFPVVSEGKIWEAICNVVRREMMDTPVGRVQTVVIQPDTKFQGVLRKNGDSFLWLTDDERRFPVRLEAKVKIGTVVASLKKVELGTSPNTGNSSTLGTVSVEPGPATSPLPSPKP